MGWIPTTHRHEWSDKDACKHAISAGRGSPSARILLPYDAAKPTQRQTLGLTLRNMQNRITKEIAGGWEFELDSHRKLEYTHANQYGDEGGGLKTTVRMDRAPAEWQLQFDLSLPDGVEAYEQLPLSQFDLDDGAYMPPHVEYSYALYNNGNKLSHIYRPFVQDNDGKRQWCSMVLVGGVLTVNLPRAWMESSERAWPIVLDPYIGYNTVGGTTHTWVADRVHSCGKSDPGEDGTAINIEVYIATSHTNGRTFGLYEDSAGAPNTLQEKTGEDTQAGQDAWFGVPFDSPTAISNGVNYWLASWQGVNWSGKRDASAVVTSMQFKDSQSYVGGTMPSPFPASPFTAQLEWSIRCEYTTGAAADAVPSLVNGGLVNRGLVNGGLVQ